MASRCPLPVLIALAALAVGACKKKGEADSDPTLVDGDGGAAAPRASPASPEPIAEPVDPDFDLDLELESDPPEPVPISESGASLFSAASDADAPVQWSIEGAEITFSTVAVGRSDAALDLQIKMESGGRSQLVTTCRGLDVAGGTGSAEAFVRGSDAIIACSTGSGSEQRSWGVRLALDEASGLVREVGRFENQGPPALETRDAGAPASP